MFSKFNKFYVSLGIRISQLVLTIVCLGLGAAMVADIAWDRVNFVVATSVLAFVYLIVLLIPYVRKFLPTLVIFIFEVMFVILWLACFAVIADVYGPLSCSNKTKRDTYDDFLSGDSNDDSYDYYYTGSPTDYYPDDYYTSSPSGYYPDDYYPEDYYYSGSAYDSYFNSCKLGKAVITMGVLSWVLFAASLTFVIIYSFIPSIKDRTLLTRDVFSYGAIFPHTIPAKVERNEANMETADENDVDSMQVPENKDHDFIELEHKDTAGVSAVDSDSIAGGAQSAVDFSKV